MVDAKKPFLLKSFEPRDKGHLRWLNHDFTWGRRAQGGDTWLQGMENTVLQRRFRQGFNSISCWFKEGKTMLNLQDEFSWE